MSANKILLPVASPLFIPFYLAKTLTFNGFDDIEFGYPNLPHGEKHIEDPLVKELYQREDCLLAIGDPMRFFRNGYYTLDTNKPVVIGSLINRMYYWLISLENTSDNNLELTKYFVHPKGMAGYAVVKHYLITEQNDSRTTSPIASINDIDTRLKDVGIPGFERYACETYKKFSGNQSEKLAYITTDVLDAITAKSEKKLVNAYYRDRVAEFHNCIMTAIVTTENKYRDNPALINSILFGISKAISFIEHDPLFSYYLVKDYSDSGVNLEDHKNLLTYIKTYQEIGIFNHDLTFNDNDVFNTIKIRDEFERISSADRNKIEECFKGDIGDSWSHIYDKNEVSCELDKKIFRPYIKEPSKFLQKYFLASFSLGLIFILDKGCPDTGCSESDKFVIVLLLLFATACIGKDYVHFVATEKRFRIISDFILSAITIAIVFAFVWIILPWWFPTRSHSGNNQNDFSLLFRLFISLSLISTYLKRFFKSERGLDRIVDVLKNKAHYYKGKCHVLNEYRPPVRPLPEFLKHWLFIFFVALLSIVVQGCG